MWHSNITEKRFGKKTIHVQSLIPPEVMLTKQKGHFSWQTFECMNDKGQKMFDKQKHAAKKM